MPLIDEGIEKGLNRRKSHRYERSIRSSSLRLMHPRNTPLPAVET